MDKLPAPIPNKTIYMYVIELESRKVFVYCSRDKAIETIFLESEIYSDFVKIYKPLHLFEKKLLMDPYDVDKMVKYYMYYYGIINVRGGSYQEIELSEDCMNTITRELKYIDISDMDKEDEIKYVLEEVGNIKKHSDDIIEKTVGVLKNNLKKYGKELEILNKIKYTTSVKSGQKVCITFTFVEEVQWLLKTCNNIINSNKSNRSDDYHYYKNRESNDVIERYLNILKILKQIYPIYQYVNPYYISNNIHNIHNIHSNIIENPHIIFDDFFYHKHRLQCMSSSTNSYNLCKMYITFIQTILNRIDEYEYDVSSWGYNYKWRTDKIVYLLDKK